jgi:hypothetical protein
MRITHTSSASITSWRRLSSHERDDGVISRQLYDRFYADQRYDGTANFDGWIHIEAKRDHRVLKGEVAEVVGADIVPFVLDRAALIEHRKLPLESRQFDVVLSDYALEHVELPEASLAECCVC